MCVLVLLTLGSNALDQKKSRWLLLRTILRRRSQFFGYQFPNSEMLDAKIASFLKNIIPNSNFKKRINQEEQKAQLDDRFFRRTQIAFMVNENFRVTGTLEAILDYADPFGQNFHCDDVQGFDTRWDEVLLSIREVHPNDILESLYETRKCECDQLKTVLA